MGFRPHPFQPLFSYMNNTIGGAPPSAPEIEQALLGILLTNQTAAQDVQTFLPEGNFYSPKHELIYDVIISMVEANDPIDVMTVYEQLRKDKIEDKIGGAYYLSELASKADAPSNLEYYSKILVEYGIRRRGHTLMLEYAKRFYDTTDDVFQVLDESQQTLFDIDSGSKGNGIVNLNDELVKEYERLKTIDGAKDGITGLGTGFTQLDKLTGGWQNSDLIIIAARPSMGKGHHPLDILPTPTGKRKVGELSIGDYVFGSDGKPTRITGVFPRGVQDFYRVTFKDDTFLDVSADHLWSVSTRNERKKSSHARVVVETKDMVDQLKTTDNRPNFAVPLNGPVEYPKQELPIHPYLLGSLLGDGYINGDTPMISSGKPELLERIQELLPDGMIMNHGSAYDYRLVDPTIRSSNRLTKMLKELGCWKKLSATKSVPRIYLESTSEDRLELLRGLLDTDGSVPIPDNSTIEYCSASPHLRDAMLELVRSLGGYITWSTKIVDGTSYYRMYLSFPYDNIKPFALKYHLDRYTPRKKTYYGKPIVDITKVPARDCICISVEADDSLYLANNFIVTHNTAISLNMVRNSWVNYGIPLGMFSFEMGTSQLSQRVLCSEARVDANAARTGRLSKEEWEQMTIAADKLKGINVFLDDSSDSSIGYVLSKARKMVRDGARGIIIDYIQLMTGNSSGGREQEVSGISRSLKKLAIELNVPIIALSQLSRAVEKRDDKRPVLSDLRESGAIEQDADVVAFIYRAERYGIEVDENGNSTEGIGQVLIRKQRNGPLGTVTLAFIDKYARFENFLEHYEPGTKVDEKGQSELNW